jgi:hypothetical protein
MGQTTTAPLRVLFVPLQHGWGADTGVEAFTGSENIFTLPAHLNAFQSIRNQCVFIDGLRSSYWGNAHDVNYSDMLTSGVRYEAPAVGAFGGPFPRPSSPSLDYLIGQQYQKGVLRFSADYTSWGASHHPMSFDNNLNSLPYYTTAQSAYMGVIDPLRLQQQQQAGGGAVNPNGMANSILLNMLGKDADRLLSKLSGSERSKMENYIGALSSLGDRIAATGGTTDLSNIILPANPGASPAFSAMVDSYLDMIRVAFTLDTHRVAVLGLGNSQSSFSWVNPQTGQVQNGNTFGNDFHQDVAHYDKGPNYTPHPVNFAAFRGWVDWHVNKITAFVNRLSQIPDVDGRSLMDNTLIVLLGEVGNGRHETANMVYTLIGGGPRVRRNRLIKTARFEPRNRQGFYWGSRDVNNNRVESTINYGPPVSTRHVADLWVAVARLAGLNINTFGIDVYNLQPFDLS